MSFISRRMSYILVVDVDLRSAFRERESGRKTILLVAWDLDAQSAKFLRAAMSCAIVLFHSKI